MGLTAAQRLLLNKAQAAGAGLQGTALDDAACCYLLAAAARDLGHAGAFPELAGPIPDVLGDIRPDAMRIDAAPFRPLAERLFGLVPDADLYFACLAALHKHRLKYLRILQTQPVPTVDEVGPRGLLQIGAVPPGALTPFMVWRKWLYTLDNRAGQEAGYLFEPFVRSAVGGVKVSAANSPVKRAGGRGKGREIDCLLPGAKRAHEMKLRVTIAASGQGRWAEELSFPADCAACGHIPVLIVFDPTPNVKLAELVAAFRRAGGESHVGPDAWSYLASLAGPTMAGFLDRYVRGPLGQVLAHAPDDPAELPDLTLKLSGGSLVITVAGQSTTIQRAGGPVPPETGAGEPADEELV
jgi:hypothetical protein